MIRVPTKKSTPKEGKLSLINSKIESAQVTLDSFSKANREIQKNIESKEVALVNIAKKQEEIEKELSDKKIFLSETDKEVIDSKKRLMEMNGLVEEQVIVNKEIKLKAQVELDEINGSIKNLKDSFEVSKKRYSGELDALKKEQEVINASMIELNKSLNTLESDIVLKNRELVKLDEVYKNKKDESEKMKLASEDMLVVTKDLRLDIEGLKEKKVIAIKDLANIDSELLKIETEKEESLKIAMELREANVSLEERGMLLNQKEQRITELYKRAGINL